jgi:diaminopimelate decarboxylase/aspartate kinase
MWYATEPGRRALRRLAAAHATPFYAYNMATIEARARDVCSMRCAARVFYAIKANSHARILKTMHAAGVAFECVSIQEVDHVLATASCVDRTIS